MAVSGGFFLVLVGLWVYSQILYSVSGKPVKTIVNHKSAEISQKNKSKTHPKRMCGTEVAVDCG